MVFQQPYHCYKKVMPDEDPLTVPLDFIEIWVQIHDLPLGFMSEAMARQFGNFLGGFLEYDATRSTLRSRRYMMVKA